MIKKILALMACSMLLFSCSQGPEQAAKHFTENLSQGKLDEAKKFCTEQTGQLLDLASGLGGSDLDPNFEFEMLKDSIEGKEAWVTFTNSEDEEETLHLVQVDGEWLVHMEFKK